MNAEARQRIEMAISGAFASGIQPFKHCPKCNSQMLIFDQVHLVCACGHVEVITEEAVRPWIEAYASAVNQ
jgi:hypothetical protein